MKYLKLVKLNRTIGVVKLTDKGGLYCIDSSVERLHLRYKGDYKIQLDTFLELGYVECEREDFDAFFIPLVLMQNEISKL